MAPNKRVAVGSHVALAAEGKAGQEAASSSDSTMIYHGVVVKVPKTGDQGPVVRVLHEDGAFDMSGSPDFQTCCWNSRHVMRVACKRCKL